MRAKLVFEQFDSPEAKSKFSKFISKDELKKFADIQRNKNEFRSGFYHGKDSADLNDKINQAMWGSKDRDAIGLAEVAYRMLVDEIPELKKYKVNDLGSDGVHALNLKNKVQLPDEKGKMDDDYSAEVNLWITYFPKEDDLLDYEEGTFKFMLAPKITTSRVSIGLHDMGKADGGESGMKDLEKALDSEEGFDRFMGRLGKLLGGSPDREDEYFNKKLLISDKNLTLDQFLEKIPEIKKKLTFFNKYVENKYGVSVL